MDQNFPKFTFTSKGEGEFSTQSFCKGKKNVIQETNKGLNKDNIAGISKLNAKICDIKNTKSDENNQLSSEWDNEKVKN